MPVNGWNRPVGKVRLVGFVLIALLLAVLGYSILDRFCSPAGGGPEPGGAYSTLIEPVPPAAPPHPALAALSIVRHGEQVALSGSLPSELARRTLLDSVLASMDDGATVVDNISIDPDRNGLDFSTAGPVFEVASAVPDFSLAVDGATVTLGGTATSAPESAAVAEAAAEAWPSATIVNKIGVAGSR